MKHLRKMNARSICVLAGCVLVAAALIWAGVWYASAAFFASRCQTYTEILRAAMPPVQNAVPEAQADNRMPVLSIDGKDFVALIEFPAYNAELPVCNDWGEPNRYPCRFAGSAYDGTLVIGSTDGFGQMAFAEMLSVGDRVHLTDMTGSRYVYHITDIQISANANREMLCNGEGELTLFVKSAMDFDYRIIRCKA